MAIVVVYDTRQIKNRTKGYLKTSEKDFTRLPNKPKHVLPNQHFFAKVKKELHVDWLDSFGWKFLSPVEQEELINSFTRKGNYYLNQANRLETLRSL